MKRLPFVVVFACAACGEPANAPPSAPIATASLDVPPLPPPKPGALREKDRVRQAPSPHDDDEEMSLLPHDTAGAEMAYQEGRKEMASGNDAKARELFLRSYRLEPAIGTLLNLALVEERLGMRDKAMVHYQAAYDAALAEGRTDRANVAKSRLDALRSKP